MRNRFIIYTCFFLLLVLCDRFTGKLVGTLAQKRIRDNRIGLLLEGKVNASVYFIGSSRALNNYDPAVVAQFTGLSCYNLGVSGTNVLFHESMLDILLENNRKPEYLFYNVDDYGMLFQMDEIIYRAENFFPYVDNPTINRMVCENRNKKEYATWVSAAYRHNVNFYNAFRYLVYGQEPADYKTTSFDSLGANLLVNRPEDPVPVYAIRKKYILNRLKPDQDYLEAFRRIQQKCLDHQIKLVLLLPPLYYPPSEYFRQLVKKEIKPGVYCFDYTYHMQDIKYFFNRDHLNKSGAQVLSRMVAEDFNKKVR